MQQLTGQAEWPVMLSLAKTFRNPFSLRLREDLGSLQWEQGRISISGKRRHEFSNVASISSVRQTIPVLALIIANILFVGLSFGHFYSTFTPENPATWIMLVVLNVVLIWSTVSTKWIRVTYQNSNGIEEAVYLLPVTSSGRRRFDGATQRLVTVLGNEVLISGERAIRA